MAYFLRDSAKGTRNSIDLAHSNFLIQIIELLEHNDFLTSQSQRIKEFYKFMTRKYPFLTFTFKGRIKSLIRTEEKFNGCILEYIYGYYKKKREVNKRRLRPFPRSANFAIRASIALPE